MPGSRSGGNRRSMPKASENAAAPVLDALDGPERRRPRPATLPDLTATLRDEGMASERLDVLR